MNRTSIYLAMAAISLGLAGCGGGGNDGSFFVPPPSAEAPPATTTTVSGTAATGAPIANANVTLRCVNSAPVTVTTADTGHWSFNLTAPTFPCLVTVSGGSLPAGTSLHSLAIGPGHVNVTPLTDLVLAKAAHAAPSTLADASPEALQALAQQLQAAQEQVFAILAAAGYPATSIDLFTADFQPTKGDVYDDLLEQLSTSLADGSTNFEELLELMASSGTSTDLPTLPNTTTFKATDLAAMPQLNKASLSSSAGVLSMRLDEGSSPVGAFVGGGTGSKAVLQLPGVAGLKLKDLSNIDIELQGDEAGVNATSPTSPYISVNLTVDLTCNAPALSSTAKLAEAQARLRVLSFDPYYHFIQGSPQISSSEFSTISITKSTPGWRISGPAVGTVPSSSNYHGTETLEGFDYATYPDACIVDGVTGDNGMFRAASCAAPSTAALDLVNDPATCATPYSGALLFLGSSSSTTASQWAVKQLSVQGTRKQTFRFE